MAKQKVKIHPSALKSVGDAYKKQIEKDMEHLHNSLVTTISASRLPTTHIVTVIAVLQREVSDMAMEEYLRIKNVQMKIPEKEDGMERASQRKSGVNDPVRTG